MTLSPSVQKANVGFVCEVPLCSLGIDWPGAECAVRGRVTMPAHAARAADPVSGGADRPGGGGGASAIRAHVRASGEKAPAHT